MSDLTKLPLTAALDGLKARDFSSEEITRAFVANIDAATVRRVAHLARIKTPEDRLEPLAAELNGILAWIEQLNEVDVAGVEPMTSNVAQPMRLRDDVVTDGDKVADVLGNAPRSADGFFVVPKVVE